MSDSDSPQEIADVFEALCAGQSREQVVDEMVGRGWSREKAASLVRSLEDRVAEFLSVEGKGDVPEPPPPEEPMKSFRLHRGRPLEELGQIAGKVAGAIVGLGVMALLAYSCSRM